MSAAEHAEDRTDCFGHGRLADTVAWKLGIRCALHDKPHGHRLAELVEEESDRAVNLGPSGR